MPLDPARIAELEGLMEKATKGAICYDPSIKRRSQAALVLPTRLLATTLKGASWLRKQ